MRAVIVILCLLTLSACGREHPLPTNHALAGETVMASATHWQALAADLAGRLAVASPPVQPVSVDMPPANSPFGASFRDMLVTELYNRGYAIGDNADEHIGFDWRVIRHGAGDKSIEGKSLEAVGAGAGIYGLYRLVRDNLSPVAGLALGGVSAGGLVAGSWIADDASSEVVINTTVRQGGAMLFRETDVYYIANGEQENFAQGHEKSAHGPVVTYAQRGAEESLAAQTRKAEAYCKKQHAVASLARRYVLSGVRYNEFACVPEGETGRFEGGNDGDEPSTSFAQ